MVFSPRKVITSQPQDTFDVGCKFFFFQFVSGQERGHGRLLVVEDRCPSILSLPTVVESIIVVFLLEGWLSYLYLSTSNHVLCLDKRNVAS